MSRRWLFVFALFAVSIAASAQDTTHPLTLPEAIARAIAHSPELAGLEAAVTGAHANAILSDGFRPGASISTTPGYSTGVPIAVLGRVPAIGTVEAHRLIYDVSARADRIGAESEVGAAKARVEEERRTLVKPTVDLSSRYAADRAQVDAAHRRVAAFTTIREHTGALRSE